MTLSPPFDRFTDRKDRLYKSSPMKNALLAVALLLSTTASSSRAQETVASLADINDATAFLAGVELPHRQDHPLTMTAAWKSHVAEFGKAFANHQERVLFPMSAWAATEVNPVQPAGGVVRYMFSGPDILHAFYMFPAAGTYIMCGLEPVGQAPNITALNEGNAGQALGEVRNALGEIINLSFFRTVDMKDDLKFATFQGTTPLMMIFLAQSGQYIKELEFLKLQKDGTLLSQQMNHTGADVVRMVFSPRRIAAEKTLYYFSADLSDGGFEKSGFGAWISGQPKGSAYLKAASFLMDADWFSKVRQHLLDHSNQIVQDDSGIPLRNIDATIWHGYYYGVYTGPISLFPDNFQSDLAKAYAGGALPLPFGTGYKWRKGESNLMRFVRKDLPALPRETPAALPAEPAPATPPPPAPNPEVKAASESPEKASE
jgi:hypothetical protein